LPQRIGKGGKGGDPWAMHPIVDEGIIEKRDGFGKYVLPMSKYFHMLRA
jgi:hypothetical protein